MLEISQVLQRFQNLLHPGVWEIFCLNHQCGNTPTLAEVWGTHKPEVRSRWKDGKTYAEIKRLKRNI